MAELLCLLVVSVTLLFCSSFAKMPTACRLKDPNLDNCLRDNINNFISLLASESLHEIFFEPLDPLKIKDLPRIDANDKELISKLALSDILVTGLGKTKVTYIRSDFSKLVNPTLEIQFTNPELVISGKWNGVLDFTFHPDGEFKLQLKDIVTKGKLIMENIKGKDGKEYFTVKSVDIDYEVGSHKIDVTNNHYSKSVEERKLADVNLGIVMGQIDLLNPFEHVLPQLKPYINDIVKNKINEYTTKIPADKIVNPN